MVKKVVMIMTQVKIKIMQVGVTLLLFYRLQVYHFVEHQCVANVKHVQLANIRTNMKLYRSNVHRVKEIILHHQLEVH